MDDIFRVIINDKDTYKDDLDIILNTERSYSDIIGLTKIDVTPTPKKCHNIYKRFFDLDIAIDLINDDYDIYGIFIVMICNYRIQNTRLYNSSSLRRLFTLSRSFIDVISNKYSIIPGYLIYKLYKNDSLVISYGEFPFLARREYKYYKGLKVFPSIEFTDNTYQYVNELSPYKRVCKLNVYVNYVQTIPDDVLVSVGFSYEERFIPPCKYLNLYCLSREIIPDTVTHLYIINSMTSISADKLPQHLELLKLTNVKIISGNLPNSLLYLKFQGDLQHIPSKLEKLKFNPTPRRSYSFPASLKYVCSYSPLIVNKVKQIEFKHYNNTLSIDKKGLVKAKIEWMQCKKNVIIYVNLTPTLTNLTLSGGMFKYVRYITLQPSTTLTHLTVDCQVNYNDFPSLVYLNTTIYSITIINLDKLKKLVVDTKNTPNLSLNVRCPMLELSIIRNSDDLNYISSGNELVYFEDTEK